MPKPAPPSDTQPPDDPPPPSRAVLAAVLRGAATDAPVIADRPGRVIGWGLQAVDVVAPRARLWGLLVWWEADGRLGRLAGAVAPGGGRWSPGCDRWPCWGDGADSVPLEPLTHLLTEAERERLQERLWDCCCWPAVEQPVRPPPPPLELPEDWWELLPS